MRRTVHILPGLLLGMLVLSAVPAAAGPTAPPAPPRDAEPVLTEQRTVGDGPHQAGFVVDDGEEVRTFCVRFDEDEIDGEELLLRTGLDVEVQHFGALGAAVCAIDGVGCPAADCHCTAAYWSYWRGDDADGWSSSPVGATSRTVRDGDRDARVWGDGRRQPPPFALDELCDATLAATVPPEAPDATDQDDRGVGTLADPATLASFIVLLALLLAGVWWVRRRR